MHDYSKMNFKKLEEEARENKSYDNVEELMKDMEEE